MDESELKRDVLELTLSRQYGDATPEQCARLERLLEDEPPAIDWYLRVVDDTVTLHAAANKQERDASGEGCSASEVAIFGRPGWAKRSSAFPLQMSRNWRTRVGWLAAACLLAALLCGPWWWSRPAVAKGDAPHDELAARVVSTANVRWANGAKPFCDWSFVQPGESLRFDSGLVSLFLSNGTELLIEGPADVEFISLEKVIARQGKLAARVGPGALGFRIETPHANVIDRGTSFGLTVDRDSRTAVVVYDGNVDLDVLGDGAPPRRRLKTGEGMVVDRRGQLSRITTVQSADFLEPPQVRAAAAEPGRVITAVSDNVRSLETAKFYRIIPRGFREDCRAYVDRLHEWNGIDDRGLPPFLRGGDYVMTFNDDKIAAEIEMAVTLSQPATLYVLIDDRVEPPAWLKRDFVDTNWDVGSDEGFEDGEIANGFGPGESIDHVCSVWRREVTEPATVILGALSHEQSDIPALAVERSMYGVVATPLY